MWFCPPNASVQWAALVTKDIAMLVIAWLSNALIVISVLAVAATVIAIGVKLGTKK
jgi:hypothetical protein